MTKRSLLWFLNLLLLGGCLLLGFMIYRDYRASLELNQIESIQFKTEKIAQVFELQPLVVTPRKFESQEFKDVVDRNLFLESRSLQSLAAAAAPENAPPLEPKPLLLGVATIGNETRAFVQSPQVQPGQKRTRLLRVGDDYQGYRVTQINSSRLELSYTSNAGIVTTHVLNLTDQRNRQLRGPVAQNAPALPSQVISIGGSQQLPAALRTSSQMASQASANPSTPGLLGNEYIDNQGRRVARTPFGDVVVPQPSMPSNQLRGMTNAGSGTGQSAQNPAQQPQSLTPRTSTPRFPYPYP